VKVDTGSNTMLRPSSGFNAVCSTHSQKYKVTALRGESQREQEDWRKTKSGQALCQIRCQCDKEKFNKTTAEANKNRGKQTEGEYAEVGMCS
jgi:hypothetical protein